MTYLKYIPGLWRVSAFEKPQPRPFAIVRPVEDGTWSSPHWEQHRDDHGLIRFDTREEAQAVCDQLNTLTTEQPT